MDKENINVNNIDGNLVLLEKIYKDINNNWTQEVNSDGDCFDFDSQDIYRHCLEQILIPSEILEKLNQETEKYERKFLLENLQKSVKHNIFIFEKYKSIIEKLPRNLLQLNEFRKRYYPNSTKNDELLTENLIYKKEIQNREKYFKSDLYKNIGFLEHNFHEEIYSFSCYLDDLIGKNFRDFKKYDPNYFEVYNMIFFNMGIVHHIHANFCNEVFDEISEEKFYKVLNLQNTLPYLKIKNIEKFLYLIFRLNKILKKEFQEQWLNGILKEIKITKKYYYKKNKAIVWGKSPKDDYKRFFEVVDHLFNNLITPLTS